MEEHEDFPLSVVYVLKMVHAVAEENYTQGWREKRVIYVGIQVFSQPFQGVLLAVYGGWFAAFVANFGCYLNRRGSNPLIPTTSYRLTSIYHHPQ